MFRACFVSAAVYLSLRQFSTNFDTEPISVLVAAAAVIVFDFVALSINWDATRTRFTYIRTALLLLMVGIVATAIAHCAFEYMADDFRFSSKFYANIRLLESR